MRRFKRLLSALAIVTAASALLIIAGCGSQTETTDIELYFADDRAVESGTPGLWGFVTAVNRSVPQTAEPLQTALEQLFKGPLPEDGDVGPVAPQTAKILEIRMEGKTAVVNLSGEALTDHPGGTLGGQIFISAMVLTATQFPEIEALKVLVEGEPWNDGHTIWEEPLRKEDMICRI